MGYDLPFALNGSNGQQAVNALVMGRNAMAATATKPALKVQGAVRTPNVDTVEFRDQLYSAVEYVVTSPVAGTIGGAATLENNKKVPLPPTRLVVPPSSWTTPVPFAVEAKTSAEAQELAVRVAEIDWRALTFEVLVSVAGGTLPVSSLLPGTEVASFRIGKYEVTWHEWQDVRDWAVANGYSDLADVGAGSSASHPVSDVSWYDVVKWCNAKSEKQGLAPAYLVNGAIYKTGQSEPTLDATAAGYRLPTEAEWEWAARGGLSSAGYIYSGSDNVDTVAWYNANSGSRKKAVGAKVPNELGIFDMSGNIYEWCEDRLPNTSRIFRGGGWYSSADRCEVGNRSAIVSPDYRAGGFGFRLARNAAP